MLRSSSRQPAALSTSKRTHHELSPHEPSRQLLTVGKLGVNFEDAAFHIQALSAVAFTALSGKEIKGTRWYTLDLKTGSASFIGTIGTGEAIRAMTLEP